MTLAEVMTVETPVRPGYAPTRVPKPPVVRIPPLENGDRLTRREFERRYAAMPHIKRAELIEGVVYVPSPVHLSHGKAHGQAIVWLGTYCAATPAVELGDNTTIRLDLDNEFQPDVLLRIDPTVGGRSRISADDYVEGAPELIMEIASSSSSYDLHDKLKVYRRNRVQEYVVWQVYDRRVDWFVLSEDEYVSLPADASGVIHSQVFPGLRLAVEALLNGDLASVLAELQKGLETPEHAAFIQRLGGEPLARQG